MSPTIIYDLVESVKVEPRSWGLNIRLEDRDGQYHRIEIHTLPRHRFDVHEQEIKAEVRNG